MPCKATLLVYSRFFVFLACGFCCINVFSEAINPKVVSVLLDSGEVINGEQLSETSEELVIKTDYGQIRVEKERISQISYQSKLLPTKRKQRNLPQKNKQLIDIWFDPTGYTLDEGEFYFSVLSWGYGYTDKLQFTTAWYKYFDGDLNIRTKYQVFERGSFSSQQAFAVGVHLHTGSLPDKYDVKTFDRIEKGYYSPEQDKFVDEERTVMATEWVRVGSEKEQGYFYEGSGSKFWGEAFAAYTWSLKRKSGGRMNITLGASGIYYPDEDMMPRVYAAVEMDLHEHIKVLGEVFYDPYYRPLYHHTEDDIDMPVFLDLGFMTNKLFGLKDLWLGIHFQQPVISGFYRF
ncbi:MAG: hypothetical protein OXE99_11770 [Cellvibrionales bacterium]|nr:hypothetical protein [Cellvibrionales bacterium]